MKSCAFFNNKGGVGKTTSLANLGSRLSEEYKVVVVDLDPQCNLTQYCIDDDRWDGIFSADKAAASSTIWSYVRPLTIGRNLESGTESEISIDTDHRFGFGLVPGHPFIAQLDDALSEDWSKLRSGTIGSIETSFWCESLTDKIKQQDPEVEYILFDLGPSLGPLNRSVLLGVDFFLSPVTPDLFSLYSFDNLETWFESLLEGIRTGQQAVKGIHREEFEDEWWLNRFDQGLKVKFLGYVSQEYVTRTTRGERRKTKALERFYREMPQKAEKLFKLLNSPTREDAPEPEIGVMPHMYSMAALAHDAHAPVGKLTAADGLMGAQFKQRDRYVEDMDEIVRNWRSRMESLVEEGRDEV